ncbi:MAG: ABC transporter ATP-binding protein [Burkholderiaceae bacterium]
MLLKTENIESFYGVSQALFGVSLDVAEGEVVTLLGRNGMGKTTTVNAIMGINPVARGQVTFAGQSISGRASFQIAQMGIGLVPEGRQVFPNLSARENLQVAAANRRAAKVSWTQDRVFDMFPQLQSRAGSMANLLSGGEQQMLAIGRALMTNPLLLILDEATEGLAPLVRTEIWRCLERIKGEGLSILLIDKNIKDLLRLADRHFILERGTVVWTGGSEALSAASDVQERYLGV